MNPVIQSLFERKSVRAYEDRAISEKNVQTILEAAVQAPTAGNMQLYTILRITDPEKLHRLSVSCDHQMFIEQAKLVLVFCADYTRWHRAFSQAGCEPRKLGEGDLMLAVCDAVIAAQNAVVAAQALDIGSCYIGDIMENIEQQRDILNLPELVFPCAMLVFGYPVPQQRERKKPQRVQMKYVVQENGYRTLSEDETRDMLGYKAGEKDYDAWIRMFCDRKYQSDFAREMSRSVGKVLEAFRP